MTALCVFTRDLRIHDNPSLSATAPAAVPLFVVDPVAERLHHSANRKAHLIECLHDLDANLRTLGSSLVVRSGSWTEVVLEVAKDSSADEIHVARDVSRYARSRIERLRSHSRIPVVEHDSITVVPPGSIAPAGSLFYRVFTPYYRRWLEQPWGLPCPAPGRIDAHGVESERLPDPATGSSPHRSSGGETRARFAMERWLAEVNRYAETRDDLGADATSRLSAALHFGTLSGRELAHSAIDAEGEAYVRQLAWRDFNAQVLGHRPEASNRDLRPGPGTMWNDDPQGLGAWTKGRTGFPIVDAGMRQLLATGWMHNRARMITASFLTKDLMIDWRLGARHFMDWLTDGDVANNQLGWQWAAGTGTDTNPTRIFNPTRQSTSHDPSGDYIRRWVAELAHVTTDEIHDPGPITREATGYPAPIVDHKEAIRAYKAARGLR